MTIIVPHHKTKEQAIATVDRSANDIFSGAAGNYVEIAEQTHHWEGSTMIFSFVARMGFIALPIHGTVDVDDVNVNVHCELPAVAKNFIGDDKVAAGIQKQLQQVL